MSAKQAQSGRLGSAWAQNTCWKCLVPPCGHGMDPAECRWIVGRAYGVACETICPELRPAGAFSEYNRHIGPPKCRGPCAAVVGASPHVPWCCHLTGDDGLIGDHRKSAGPNAGLPSAVDRRRDGSASLGMGPHPYQGPRNRLSETACCAIRAGRIADVAGDQWVSSWCNAGKSSNAGVRYNRVLPQHILPAAQSANLALVFIKRAVDQLHVF